MLMEIIKMKTKALSLSIWYFMMELNQRSIQTGDFKITSESSWDITILKIEITIKRMGYNNSENRNYNKKKKRYKHHNKLTSSHTKFSKIDF